MSAHAQRYFASALGCAIAAIGVTAGLVAAVACAGTAAVFYGFVAAVQTGRLRRLLTARQAGAAPRVSAPGRSARRAPRKVSRERRRPAAVPFVDSVDSDEPSRAAGVGYGW